METGIPALDPPAAPAAAPNQAKTGVIRFAVAKSGGETTTYGIETFVGILVSKNPVIVELGLKAGDVERVEKAGADLRLRVKFGGESMPLLIANFFVDDQDEDADGIFLAGEDACERPWKVDPAKLGGLDPASLDLLLAGTAEPPAPEACGTQPAEPPPETKKWWKNPLVMAGGAALLGAAAAVAADGGSGDDGAPAADGEADTQAPSPPEIAGIAGHPDGTATVSGTAEPGATVRVTFPSGSVVEGMADAAGDFAIDSEDVQSSGEVTVTATDAAGNASEPASGTYVDRVPPDAPEVEGVANETVAGVAQTVVSGTAEPGTTVIVYDGEGVELGSATAAVEDGRFAVVLQGAALTDGETLTVTAFDADGNASAPAEATAPDDGGAASAAALSFLSGWLADGGDAEATLAVHVGDGVLLELGGEGNFSGGSSPDGIAPLFSQRQDDEFAALLQASMHPL